MPQKRDRASQKLPPTTRPPTMRPNMKRLHRVLRLGLTFDDGAVGKSQGQPLGVELVLGFDLHHPADLTLSH